MTPWNLSVTKIFLMIALLLLATPASAASLVSSTNANHVLLATVVTALLMFLLLGIALQIIAKGYESTESAVMFKASLTSAWAVLVFAVVGYGLMFGENNTGLWGASLFFFSGDVGIVLIFYSMLAALLVLITGSAIMHYLSDRMHLIMSMLLILVFAIVGGWVWSEQGWLHKQGFIDVAGATVLHSVAGWMVLGALIGLGKQRDAIKEMDVIPNTAFSGMSIILIWLGWLGLTLGATVYTHYTLPDAALDHALLNTFLAGFAGMIGASLASYMVNDKLDLTMIASGSIAGLVSISAGVTMMQPVFALLTALVGGAIAVFSVLVLRDMNIHDRTAAISAHAMPGVWGTLAAGVFYSGDFFNPDRVLVQMMGVAVIFGVVFTLTWLLFRGVREVLGSKDLLNGQ